AASFPLRDKALPGERGRWLGGSDCAERRCGRLFAQAASPCALGGFQIAAMPPEWAAAELVAGRGGNTDGYAGGAWRRQAAAGVSRTRPRIAADAGRRR